MAAYLIRRLLLVIPTLWAIITINFYRASCPGGPVDQAIAAIELGHGSGFGGGGAGEGTGMPGRASRQATANTAVHAARSGGDRRDHKTLRLRQTAARTLLHHAVELYALRLRRQPVSRRFGDAADRPEPAGLHHAGPLEHADHLPVSIPLGIRKAVHNGSAFDTGAAR